MSNKKTTKAASEPKTPKKAKAAKKKTAPPVTEVTAIPEAAPVETTVAEDSSAEPGAPEAAVPGTTPDAAAEPASSEPTAPSMDGFHEALKTPDFAAAWAEWLKFTDERGIGLEARDKERQLDLLAKLGPDAAIADIRKTMAEHPLKDNVVATAGGSGKKARKERKVRGPKAGKMSALDAAAKVLDETGGSMTTQEMIAVMAKKGYWSSPGGLTPAATLYSAILRETNTKGKDARFVKTERGKFARA